MRDRTDIACPSEMTASSVRQPMTWDDLKHFDHRSDGMRRAKWHIVSCLVQLVEDGADLGKLSIKDIAAAAGTSRQTFYNHFIDKYDAINWLRARIDECTMNRIGIDTTWEWAIEDRLEIMKYAPRFFIEVFRAEEFYDYASSEAESVHSFYKENIQRATGRTLSETESYLMKLYAEGAVRTTVSWLRDDRGKSSSFMVRVLGQSLPDFARGIFFTYSYKNATEE